MHSGEKINIIIFSFLSVFMLTLAINNVLHKQYELVYSNLMVAMVMLMNLLATLSRIYTNHPLRFRASNPPIIYPQPVVKQWLKINIILMPILIILCNVFGIMANRENHSIFIYAILLLITVTFTFVLIKDIQRLKSV